jgi:hypothetical protein
MKELMALAARLPGRFGGYLSLPMVTCPDENDNNLTCRF